MANINVSYQDMHDAATRLNSGKEEITSKLTDLQAFIKDLVGNGFVTDQASVAFNDTYIKYTESAKKVIESLTDLATYLTKAAEAYDNTDTSLGSALRSN